MKARQSKEEGDPLFSQLSVDIVGEPEWKWREWHSNELRCLPPLIPLDALRVLIVNIDVKSPVNREIELSLKLHERWFEIPDNEPRLQKVSTRKFPVCFDIDRTVSPGMYHAVLIVKPAAGEIIERPVSFYVPAVYAEG